MNKNGILVKFEIYGKILQKINQLVNQVAWGSQNHVGAKLNEHYTITYHNVVMLTYYFMMMIMLEPLLVLC